MKRSVLGRAIALMVDAGMTISDATVVANAIGTEFAAQGFYAGARAVEEVMALINGTSSEVPN